MKSCVTRISWCIMYVPCAQRQSNIRIAVNFSRSYVAFCICLFQTRDIYWTDRATKATPSRISFLFRFTNETRINIHASDFIYSATTFFDEHSFNPAIAVSITSYLFVEGFITWDFIQIFNAYARTDFNSKRMKLSMYISTVGTSRLMIIQNIIEQEWIR